MNDRHCRTDRTTVLLVDNRQPAVNSITDTLHNCNHLVISVTTNEKAYQALRTNPEISLIVVRYSAPGIDGDALCRHVQLLNGTARPAVLMIVPEDEPEQAKAALAAGAGDLLIEPFEPRELRMKSGLVSPGLRHRVDDPHPIESRSTVSRAAAAKDVVPELRDASGTDVRTTDCESDSAATGKLIEPFFDASQRRFVYPVDDETLLRWNDDDRIVRVTLDKVLVCPECRSVPTFRPGCGKCGSGCSERETLIHHYACAHMGPESDFRNGNDFKCPKCRLSGMVVGADFEVVSGVCRCADCGQISGDEELIGHCLSCQNRFPAREAELLTLVGYHLPMQRRSDVPIPPGSRFEGRRRRSVESTPVS